MITELVLLMGFLGFLAIRNDYVLRRGPFILAVVFWGLARVLTELTFGAGTNYEYGSRSACAAAVCIFLSLLCMYWACARSLRQVHAPPSRPAERPQEPVPAPEAKDPSERIRELIE